MHKLCMHAYWVDSMRTGASLIYRLCTQVHMDRVSHRLSISYRDQSDKLHAFTLCAQTLFIVRGNSPVILQGKFQL